MARHTQQRDFAVGGQRQGFILVAKQGSAILYNLLVHLFAGFHQLSDAVEL